MLGAVADRGSTRPAQTRARSLRLLTQRRFSDFSEHSEVSSILGPAHPEESPPPCPPTALQSSSRAPRGANGCSPDPDKPKKMTEIPFHPCLPHMSHIGMFIYYQQLWFPHYGAFIIIKMSLIFTFQTSFSFRLSMCVFGGRAVNGG